MAFADHNINTYGHPFFPMIAQAPGLPGYINQALNPLAAVGGMYQTPAAQQYFQTGLDLAQPALDLGVEMLGPAMGSQRGGPSGVQAAFLGRAIPQISNQLMQDWARIGGTAALTPAQQLPSMLYATAPDRTVTPDMGPLDYLAQLGMGALQDPLSKGISYLGGQAWDWLTGTPTGTTQQTPQQAGGGGGIGTPGAVGGLGAGYQAYQALQGPTIGGPQVPINLTTPTSTGGYPTTGVTLDPMFTDPMMTPTAPPPTAPPPTGGLSGPAPGPTTYTGGVGLGGTGGTGAGVAVMTHGADATLAGLGSGSGTLGQALAQSPVAMPLALGGFAYGLSQLPSIQGGSRSGNIDPITLTSLSEATRGENLTNEKFVHRMQQIPGGQSYQDLVGFFHEHLRIPRDQIFGNELAIARMFMEMPEYRMMANYQAPRYDPLTGMTGGMIT